MSWWVWVIIGSIVFAAELVAIDAQFYLVFIGISAAIVGFLGWIGVDMAPWMQWLTFGSLSLITTFTFRKSLYAKLHANLPGHAEGVDGDSLVIRENLAAKKEARVSFRGSEWTVINEGDSEISSGSRVSIVRREGLKLYVNADVA